MHFGKVIILTRGRDTCEEAVMKIKRACPVELRLGHVTCSGQLNVNRGMSIPGRSFHSPCVAHQVDFSFSHNDQQCSR